MAATGYIPVIYTTIIKIEASKLELTAYITIAVDAILANSNIDNADLTNVCTDCWSSNRIISESYTLKPRQPWNVK